MQISLSIWLSVRPRDVCLELNLCQHPDLPDHPPHVSISQALPWALASWGIPPFRSHLAGYLLRRAESARKVTPFREFTLRGFRPNTVYLRMTAKSARPFSRRNQAGSWPFDAVFRQEPASEEKPFLHVHV
jgi:hypothetical protein